MKISWDYLRDREKFECLLAKLSMEEKLKLIEEIKNVIGEEANPEVIAVALKEYLKSVLAKQVKFGKKSYSIDVSPRKIGIIIEVPTLVINEKEEIPIRFDIITTKSIPFEDLLGEEMYQKYGVSLKVIHGVETFHSRYLYGIELDFLPIKGYALYGHVIRREFPSWASRVADIYNDKKTEKVIELIEKGGISIEWQEVASEIARDLGLCAWNFCKTCSIDWEEIARCNERLRKKRGLYRKKRTLQ